MYFIFKLVSLAILVLNAIKLAPLVEASSEAEEQRFSLAKEYLCRYGYMYKNLCYFRKQKADDFLRLHAKPMREGLRLFQRYFNLTEDDGKISSAGIIKMGSPRCGNPDRVYKPPRNQKAIDYSTFFHENDDESNETNVISYQVKNYNFYSKQVSRSASNEYVDVIINKAFHVWLDNLKANFTLKKVKNTYEVFKNTPVGDVQFIFGAGRHGDAMPFDGPNGEFGHASATSAVSFKGSVHLDDEEDWTLDNKLLLVMTHEIGHLFGLNHSSNPNSIMSPLYAQRSDPILDEEDLLNLQTSLGLKLKEKEVFVEDFVNGTKLGDGFEVPGQNETSLETTSWAETTTEVTSEEMSSTKPAPAKVIEKQLSFLEKLINRLKGLKSTEESTTMKMTTTSTTTTATTTTSTTTITTTTTTTITTTTTTITTTTTTTTTTSTTTTTESTEPEVTEPLPVESILDSIIFGMQDQVPEVDHRSKPIIKLWELTEKYDIDPLPTTKAANFEFIDRFSERQQYSVAAKQQDGRSPASSDQEYEYLLKLLGVPAKLINLEQSTTKDTKTTVISKKSTTTMSKEAARFRSRGQIKRTKDLFFETFCMRVPAIDAITKTEYGNAFVFADDLVWHVRDLTKWRVVDYENWPKQISTLFPQLPDKIDAAFLLDNYYFFTKNELIWKYKISQSFISHTSVYELERDYPKVILEEYPDIPFVSVDSAFALGNSTFFFKDLEFWQSTWGYNVKRQIPFKTDAAIAWKAPESGMEFSYEEPLAYLVSGVSMHQFNFWNVNIQSKNVDIRYFLFDCLGVHPNPSNHAGLDYN